MSLCYCFLTFVIFLGGRGRVLIGGGGGEKSVDSWSSLSIEVV